ncbi:hypothetical protein SYNTR_2257 [Candidatus Syntrophocurvum alkaliphilum]|uniref:DUF2922 domain-containing protein n=1 Tax=Candidatus Syntrophocurvum alkaliphilum TaxID=2293317 RepID=A0A6I6DPF6_9FIRM|nr:DUF2922 domain-containing protein [Candidatus Syntrophocurvum alkaliphilum]QGU00851.1 hypothetical protein SYNTR_2257 [Candidatus Syntrophocurvum alkaliphilum]
MSITTTLEMDFENQAGRNVKLRVNEANEDIEQTEVLSVMNSILSKDIFTSNGGDLVSKRGAQLVQREVTSFEIE